MLSDSAPGSTQAALVWHSDYDELFSQRGGGEPAADPVADVLDRAARTGRVLLVGAPTSGKSKILRGVAVAALGSGITCLSVELAELWPAAPHDYPLEARSHFAKALTDRLLAAGVAPAGEASTLLLIDSLDRSNQGLGHSLLDAVTEVTALYSRVSVVVADGLWRRSIRMDRWSLAAVGSVSSGRLVPFAVDSAEPLSPAIEAWFEHHYGIAMDDELAGFALAVSRRGSRLTGCIERGLLDLDHADEQARAIEAGLLRSVGTGWLLDHVIAQDSLVSKALSVSPSLWRKDVFDSVTAAGTRFLPLALTLDRLTTPNDRRSFVQCVYDWNWLSAAPIFQSFPGAAPTTVGVEDEEFAITVGLAQRRWDPILGTAQTAEDQLVLLESPLARQLSAAESPEAVRQIVESRRGKGSSQFDLWMDVFLHDRSASDDLRLVPSDNRLLAWTVVNESKTWKLKSAEVASVARLLDSDVDEHRWRAAHLLGAYPSATTAERLYKHARADRFRWVRRTASRSLVEMLIACDDDQLRMDLSEYIVDIVNTTNVRRVLSEIERSLMPRPELTTWEYVDHALRIVSALVLRSTDPGSRDRLESLGIRLSGTVS